MQGSESKSGRGVRRWRRGIGWALAGLALLLGGLFFGPFQFDEGPLWHARVVATRDALHDIALREPHVLVIGDPAKAAEQGAALERRLSARGLHVRYTGDQTMSPWERRYVAVYWSIVGMLFEPPVG